jgi:hypothetical protein
MKALTLVFLFFACTVSLHADILVNGDFADGRAHWKGDAKDPDATDNLSGPSPLGGVTIELKKDKWTKIYQTFSTHAKKLHYSITFALSSDYKPDTDQPEGGMSPSPGLDDIEGLYPLYGYGRGGTWMCITAQGYNESSFMLHPDAKKTDPQTLTGTIPGPPDVSNEMMIIFAFPPGVGTITLTKIALTGDGDD